MTNAPSDRRSAVGLLVSLAVCFAASGIGGLFTSSSVGGWYQTLERPSWNPPDWLFAPVWTSLFAAMAVAAWLVWRRDRRWSGALTLFAIQLALNVLWSALFFGLRSPGAALIEIVLLLVAIAATAVAFWRRSRAAGALMIPYGLWVGFATALTAAIWVLNR